MTIKLYWCRGEGDKDQNKQNFGDYLSPLLVEMLSKKKVIFSPAKSADMIAIGTVLVREQRAKRFLFPRKLHIWGAGAGAATEAFSPRHHYHAVRGTYTVKQIPGLTSAPAIGDPGLLSSQWWDGRPKPAKRYRLGIVPHYLDKKHPLIGAASDLSDVIVIDVFWPVEKVLETIQMCDVILSSSLHGLVVADSFRVPNRRLVLSSREIPDYKFIDYYSAFGLEQPTPLNGNTLESALLINDSTRLVEDYSRPHLVDIQASLVNSFPNL
jgi:hypothetical protein